MSSAHETSVEAPRRALAIESSSRRGEVALVERSQVIAVQAFEAGVRHTAGLVPLVSDLCRAHGWPPLSIDGVYVSVGPGGFTGTRIGVTFAKTLAFASGARVVAVPTAEVLLGNLPVEAVQALVVVDARRGKVWTEHFTRPTATDPWRREGPGVLSRLGERIASVRRPLWLIGEGVAYHAAELPQARAGVHVVEDNVPQAVEVARIGATMAREGRFTGPEDLRPLYVRRPEAEEKRLGLS